MTAERSSTTACRICPESWPRSGGGVAASSAALIAARRRSNTLTLADRLGVERREHPRDGGRLALGARHLGPFARRDRFNARELVPAFLAFVFVGWHESGPSIKT